MVMINHISAPSGEKASKKRRKSKRKTGGYPMHRVMLRQKAREVRHAVKVMQDSGVKPNLFLSINLEPIEGETITERKKRLGREVSKIGTIFTRQDHEFHCVTVYEYPANGNLHCHLAVHVPRQVKPFLKQWVTGKGVWDETDQGPKQGYEVHACPYKAHRLSYMLKESQWPCDPAEWKPTENDMFRRRSGNAFRGKRVHMPKATRLLLSKPAKPIPVEMKQAA